MAAVIGIIAAAITLAAATYDAARLISPDEPRRPPLARLRGRRAALEATETWRTGLRIHGRIDQAAYQQRMADLAHGHRTHHAPATPARR
ncbi:hypothetical protein ACFVHB_10085 [Kitasatospora sp. NPDC127111]|uniref:hypothetical protein n=1 Tax=Kitasatospora sp. NPDC127111 TaxID=3345363 RepID=UPI00363F3996